MRNKPVAPPTIEDVIRYLRQCGDIVVTNGDTYMVNYNLKLTAAELIDRANAKRRVRNQPTFEPLGVVAKPAAECADCASA